MTFPPSLIFFFDLPPPARHLGCSALDGCGGRGGVVGDVIHGERLDPTEEEVQEAKGQGISDLILILDLIGCLLRIIFTLFLSQPQKIPDPESSEQEFEEVGAPEKETRKEKKPTAKETPSKDKKKGAAAFAEKMKRKG